MDNNTLFTYVAPKEMPENTDFSVRVGTGDGEWQQLFTYLVKVDMHQVREASMVQFDFTGKVQVEVTCHRMQVQDVLIRPLSFGIKYAVEGNVITFELDQPRKFSLEVNGDRFHNLHIFAQTPDLHAPDTESSTVAIIEPGIHRTEELLKKLTDRVDTLYFLPGMHHIEQVALSIPSKKHVYLAGGAVVVGSMVCDRVEHVSIRGRGIIYLSDFGRFTAFRGVRLMHAEHIVIDGITVVDPPHYSIYIGQSKHVRISDFKAFSTRGWSDGIDMMASTDIEISDIFMRNSDDCIAIYGHRWDYYGDTRNITVKDAVLWADVAHPTMIGAHGDYHGDGGIIENIVFDNIDILEQHEPQQDYRGCMAINAGDKNTVRHVHYENIRVEPFELGRLFDIRVMWNKKYNPSPGKRIEHITFKNITYRGEGEDTSYIEGYDAERFVSDVTFEEIYMNGKKIENAADGHIHIGDHTEGIRFL